MTKTLGIFLFSLLAALPLFGQQFADVTSDVGIEHVHVSSIVMGGGAVFIDYDNDGWQDIYMTGGESADRLYRNIEGASFEDVSVTALPFIKGDKVSSGVVALDFDNNGCRDLFITTISNDFPNVLLINNCDGTFSNISAPAGITHSSWSMGASISDVNQDGFQDIYVINYVKQSKTLRDDNDVVTGFDHDCYQDYLYLNDGNGQFAEIGIAQDIGSTGCGLAVSNIDFLEDGSKGFYIANDFGEWVEPNALFKWNDESASSVDYGLDIGLYSMGIAIGDIDDDQDFDLYITNIGKNFLMINEDNFFQDQAEEFDVKNEFVRDSLNTVSWGTFFADLDNDRDQDLFVANGFIELAEFIEAGQLDPNKVYENQSGTMVDVSSDWGLDFQAINRGAIYGDYNNDGFVDILVSNVSGADIGTSENLTYKLYENQGNDNHYVKLLLEGDVDKDAFGAVVSVHADGQSRKQILLSSGTHASQHDKSLIFGLGSLNSLDSVTVNWPDGDSQSFFSLGIDETYLLTQSDNSTSLLGCTDPNSKNYNPNAIVNHGCIANSTAVVETLEDLDLEIFVNGTELYFNGDIQQFQNIDLTLFNTLGQITIQKTNHDLSPIDISYLHTGMYSILLMVKEKLYSKKIIVIND